MKKNQIETEKIGVKMKFKNKVFVVDNNFKISGKEIQKIIVSGDPFLINVEDLNGEKTRVFTTKKHAENFIKQHAEKKLKNLNGQIEQINKVIKNAT